MSVELAALRIVGVGRAAVEGLGATLGTAAWVECVTRVDEGFAALRPDAVLIECGDGDPSATLAAVRSQTAAPIIAVAADPSRDLVAWALDAGLADVVSPNHSTASIVFAVEKAVRQAREATPAAEAARVVTVFSPKGGTGKSSIATNLAAALALDGQRRALLVDMDMQFGDAPVMLGLWPQKTVRDLLAGNGDALEDCVESHYSGLSVLGAPARPEDAELVPDDAIATVLAAARRTYQAVVVDTSPLFHGGLLATLDTTDELVLVCTPDIPTVRNVRLTLKTLELLAFPEERVRLVLNRAAPPPAARRREIESTLQRRVDVVLPYDVRVTAAVNSATPAVIAAPGTPFSSGILELASLLFPSFPPPRRSLSARMRRHVRA